MNLKNVLLSLAILAGSVAAMSGTTSCAPAPDRHRSTFVLLPDYKIYHDNVDAYLQRRCGTLDCHGQPGRAYRLYGFGGLRDDTEDAGLVSGQQPTTEDEIRANFDAAVAVEPEEMSRLIATQGADPNKLLLLRKPLRLERHKGGPAMSEDDVGYRCVVAWLRIRTVRASATDPTQIETIPESDRDAFPERSKNDCLNAASNP